MAKKQKKRVVKKAAKPAKRAAKFGRPALQCHYIGPARARTTKGDIFFTSACTYYVTGRAGKKPLRTRVFFKYLT